MLRRLIDTVLPVTILAVANSSRALADEPVRSSPPHRVYATLMNPREHPDDSRRHVKPPNWDAVGNRTRFTVLRGFGVEKDRIVGYREEIDKYVRDYELGDVLWPAYTMLSASNLGDVIDEIKRRDLFLFDLWGYVPGSGPGDYCQQFKVPRDVRHIEKLPRNATGKIMRRELKGQVAK